MRRRRTNISNPHFGRAGVYRIIRGSKRCELFVFLKNVIIFTRPKQGITPHFESVATRFTQEQLDATARTPVGPRDREKRRRRRANETRLSKREIVYNKSQYQAFLDKSMFFWRNRSIIFPLEPVVRVRLY
jgi:hypothetical protein